MVASLQDIRQRTHDVATVEQRKRAIPLGHIERQGLVSKRHTRVQPSPRDGSKRHCQTNWVGPEESTIEGSQAAS